MKNVMRSRKLLAGACLAGLMAVTGAAPAQTGGDPMVPWFEADPYWPKPLPNHWRLAAVIGLATDARDNVWIVHRPQTLEQKESYAARKEAECCVAAPDVLAFDPAGNVIKHWGRDEVRGNGHDWPSSNHGITIGPDTPPAWMMWVTRSRAISSRSRARSDRSSRTRVAAEGTGSSPITALPLAASRVTIACPTNPLEPVTRVTVMVRSCSLRDARRRRDAGYRIAGPAMSLCPPLPPGAFPACQDHNR